MSTAKPALNQVIPLGDLIDEAFDVREARRKLAIEDRALVKRMEELEQKIFAKLDAEKTDRGASKKASASITTTEEPRVVDWEAFCAYAKRTGNMHLFQRRVSAPAWRELRSMKKAEVPGLEAFESRNLNLRVISK